MSDETRFDAQIAALYRAGTNAIEIARQLDLRVPEVIGRIRALDLKPMGMAERRAAPLVEAAPAPLPAAAASLASLGAAASVSAASDLRAGSSHTAGSGAPAPAPRQIVRPRVATQTRSEVRGGPLRVSRAVPATARMAAPQRVGRDFDEDDDDDCDVVRVAGRPKGWLVSEARLREMYARMGGRY